MTLSVVQFPEHAAAYDIPSALRKLAKQVEIGLIGLPVAHAMTEESKS